MIISYFFNIRSDRQLCREIKFNIAYRWFCKLSLQDKIPHHSSLTRIRDRLGLLTFQQFFLTLIEKCKALGLVKGEQVMTDSTLFQANASLDSLSPLPDELESYESKGSLSPGLKAPPVRKISNKTHQSKTDPDASLAFKMGSVRALKYKAHLTIDAPSRIILDAHVTTGAIHESQVFLDRLSLIEKNFSFQIREAIADRAYGSAAILHALEERNIVPVMAPFSTRNGASILNESEGFHFVKEKNYYVCPAGALLKGFRQGSSMTYVSRPNTCQRCTLASHCKAKKRQRNHRRYIIRHIHQELLDKMKAQLEAPAFQLKLKERMWKLEGLMNEIKHYHGLGRARYRSWTKTQIQAYLAASILNIKRLIAFFWLLFFGCRNKNLRPKEVCFGRNSALFALNFLKITFFNRPVRLMR